MNELFPSFRRLFSAIGRGARWTVTFPIRTARRSWKPALVAFLCLYVAAGISNRLEIRFMKQPIIEQPEQSFDAWRERQVKLRSHRNPYAHYAAIYHLADSESFETIQRYRWERDAIQYRAHSDPEDDETLPGYYPDPVTDEELEDAIAALQPIVALLRAGAECSIANLAFQDEYASSRWRHDAWYFLELAPAICLLAEKMTEQGQDAEAVMLLLDLLEMGNDFRHNASLETIGYVIKNRAARSIQRHIADGVLEAEHYRKLARELHRIDGERPSYQSVLEGWYQLSRAELAHFLDLRYAGVRYRETVDNDYSPLANPWLYVYKAIPGLKTWVVANHNRAWKRIFATQTLPYPDAVKLFDEILHTPDTIICAHCSTEDKLTPKLDPVNKEFVPGMAFRGSLVANAKDKATLTGLMLMAALEAYRLERGAYPESLDSLARDYLASIPTDPFTDGKPFVYSKTEDSYMLYSVGPNMTDDGGTPAVGSYPTRDKPGDIVFAPGVGLWREK